MWAIDTRHTAEIHSFEAAEKHWDEAVGWKNEHTSWKPLDKRTKRHLRMVKFSGGGYECVLHNTAVVTYYPGGDVALRTWPSQSTQYFAECVHPRGCHPVSHKGYMFWAIDTAEGKEYHREDGKGPLLLVPNKDVGTWAVTNPGSQEKEFVLDRKKAAAVRKTLRPYKQWSEMTTRLSGNHGALTYDSSPYIKALLERPEEVEKFPIIFKAIGTPDRFMYAAYELAGARSKQPVPRTRLPKEITV